MKDNILYFPSISFPGSEWGIKSLLYWNEIGVIVPSDYTYKPQLHTNDMTKLVETGFVKQIISDHYMGNQYKISDTLISVFTNSNYDLLNKQLNFRNRNYWKINQQKFSNDLFNTLVELEIAFKAENKKYTSWYFVEEKTASIMMNLLATTISNDIGYTPVTDNEANIKSKDFIGLTKNGLNDIREYVLDEVMPFPTNCDYKLLLRFKEKYNSQLIDFRRKIETLCLGLASMPNNDIRANLLQREIEGINDTRDELIAKLNESNFKSVSIGVLKGVFIDCAIALITGDPISPAATALSGLNEIRNAYDANPIRDNDLAYLALLNNKIN